MQFKKKKNIVVTLLDSVNIAIATVYMYIVATLWLVCDACMC